MKCICCDYKDTDVKNSRKIGDNNSVWRRRDEEGVAKVEGG